MGGVIDVLPALIERKELDLPLHTATDFIGKELPGEFRCILKALEFDVTETEDADVLHLTVLTYTVWMYTAPAM